MNLKHLGRIWLGALLAAWGFDLLFWQKMPPGISFFAYVGVCLAVGFLLAWSEKVRPAWRTLLMAGVVLFFAAMAFVRREPLTVFLNATLSLTGLALLAYTFRSGSWTLFSLSDYIVAGGRFCIQALVGGGALFSARRSQPAAPLSGEAADPGVESAGQPAAPAAQKSSPRSHILPVVRGLLLALPVVFVLAALLASADPIFSRMLGDFAKLFSVEKWGEYIFRLSYILVGAYLLAGIYFYALAKSGEHKLIGVEKPWLAPFLGWTEAVIVLGSVEVLFAIFLGVQFTYFFGGQTNIHLEGFTYSEYARRGFSELVAVAVISLLLFLSLSSVTRRAAVLQRRSFSGLGVGLVVLVGVILVSAYQRLVLYETVYGFSQLRTYTHVFMVWLGILLAATVALELLRRPRTFALAAVIVWAGFVLTLTLLNVDGFIVRQNVARARAGGELDGYYFNSLSTDAIPVMFELYAGGDPNAAWRQDLGAALACRMVSGPAYPRPKQAWQSFTAPDSQADALFARYHDELNSLLSKDYDDAWQVKRAGGQTRSCFNNWYMD